MSAISYHCEQCHLPPVIGDPSCGDLISAKWDNMCAKISSNLYVSKKTIKAYPLSSILIPLAIAVAVIAVPVLLGASVMVAPELGAILAFSGLVALTAFFPFITILGSFAMHIQRKDVEQDLYKKAHTFEKMESHIIDKKVCLFIEATEDWNGALQKKPYEGIEAKYPLVHVKVSNLQEFTKAIEDVAEVATIQLLWIAGHGTPERIELGPAEGIEPVINFANVNTLAPGFNCLADDASIVLYSCNTGKVQADSFNIAQKISENAPGRKILAPCVESNQSCIRSKKDLKLSMQKPPLGVFGSFIDLLLPNIVGECFRDNIMNVFKDGVLQEDMPTYVKI